MRPKVVLVEEVRTEDRLKVFDAKVGLSAVEDLEVSKAVRTVDQLRVTGCRASAPNWRLHRRKRKAIDSRTRSILSERFRQADLVATARQRIARTDSTSDLQTASQASRSPPQLAVEVRRRQSVYKRVEGAKEDDALLVDTWQRRRIDRRRRFEVHGPSFKENIRISPSRSDSM